MRVHVYSIPLKNTFRGLNVREGVLVEHGGRWAEWSPFSEYDDEIASRWLRATLSQLTDRREPLRASVPVNVTVPEVGPERAAEIVAGSGCATAKVKVAGNSSLEDDVARVKAVRQALGAEGRVRVDANGSWSVPEALRALEKLGEVGLEYAEQPCASVEELARLRKELAKSGLAVPIAADESIRRAEDPLRVAALDAADVVVLKVQPLGGVEKVLELAEKLAPRKVVISSALETSVGIHASLRAACLLPSLDAACGINTVRLFTGDVVAEPLIAKRGELTLGPCPEPSQELLAEYAAPEPRARWWRERLERCREIVSEEAA